MKFHYMLRNVALQREEHEWIAKSSNEIFLGPLLLELMAIYYYPLLVKLIS